MDNQEKHKKLDELQREVLGLDKKEVEEVNPTIGLKDDDANKNIHVKIVRNKGVVCSDDQL